jgi:hypothetical protein
MENMGGIEMNGEQQKMNIDVIKAELQRVKVDPNDIIIVKVGDKSSGGFPSQNVLIDYKDRLNEMFQSQGILNKIIITHPYTEFYTIKNLTENDWLIVTVGDKDKGFLPDEKIIKSWADLLKREGIKKAFIVSPYVTFQIKGDKITSKKTKMNGKIDKKGEVNKNGSK